MTILSRPASTTSYRAWETIAGGTNNFLVQRRTVDGLDKNKTMVHRATHKATDLTKFRIIYSNIQDDFIAGGGAASITPRTSIESSKGKEVRMTVAVADTSADIMQDWEEVKECWRRAGGVVDMKGWELFYQGIVRLRAEEEAENSREAASISFTAVQEEPSVQNAASTSMLQSPASDDFGAESSGHPEPSPNSPHDAGSANNSFAADNTIRRGAQKEDTTAKADHHSGCSEEEVWAARLVGAWLWTDAYQSIVMLCLFAHGYYARWMSWWTAIVILYLAGLTFPRYRRHSFDTTEADIAGDLGMNGEEIRTLVGKIRSWQQRLGLGSPKAIQSKMASVVLLNYSMCVFMPNGLTLRVAFEGIVCPLVAVSLVISLLYVLLFSKRPTRAESVSVSSATAPNAHAQHQDIVAAVDRAEPNDRDASPLPVDPAPAPRDTSKFSDLIREPLKLYRSNQWKFKSKTDGVIFEEMPSPACDKKACRFTINVPHATAFAMEKMLCDDPEGNNKSSYAYRFDTLLSGKQLIESLSDGTVIMQTRYKSPVFGISPRDMMTRLNPSTFITSRADQEALGIVPSSFQGVANGATGAVFIQSGLDHGKKVPAFKGHCRGAVHSYLIMGQEEEDGSLTIVLALSVDPQGSIPAKFVELTNGEQVKKLQIMRTILQEIGPIKKETPPASVEDVTGAVIDNIEGSHQQQNDAPDLAMSTSGVADIDENVRRWFDLLHSKQWVHQQTKDGVSYALAPSPWCDKKAVRVEMFVEGVKAHCLDRVINNPENATKYDRLLRSREKLRDVTDRVAIMQNFYASPIFGVSARDFVVSTTPKTYLGHEQQAEYRLLDIPACTPGAERGVAFLSCSADAGSDFPPHPKFSRGAVHSHGILAQEEIIDGAVVGVHLIQASSVDPCGRIPASLVDATNIEQIEKLKIIAKLMKSVS